MASGGGREGRAELGMAAVRSLAVRQGSAWTWQAGSCRVFLHRRNILLISSDCLHALLTGGERAAAAGAAAAPDDGAGALVLVVAGADGGRDRGLRWRGRVPRDARSGRAADPRRVPHHQAR